MSTKEEPTTETTTEPVLELTAEESTEPTGSVDELQIKGLKISGLEAKYNSAGQAICRLCGQAFRDLTDHLKKEHKTTAEDYETRFPGFPVKGVNSGSVGSLVYEEREKKLFSVKKTFDFLWNPKAKKAEKRDKMVTGYKTPGPLTPPIDPDYVFDPEATQVVLLGLHLKDKVLVYGPTGSGKTSIIEQICARLNLNFVRINFDSAITRADLIGHYVVKGEGEKREMEFCYGILPRAMALPGTVVLLDEWDTIGEEVSFVLQRPLEKNSQLLIMEEGEKLISLHPENTIIATANTAGMGDDTGLYSQGTRIQNYAQINRFAMTVILDYLDAKQEQKILMNRFGGDIEEWEAEAIIKAINAVREAFVNGQLSAPLSTRDAINWAEKFCIWGNPQKSAKFCFINRSPQEERGTLEGLVQRAFD